MPSRTVKSTYERLPPEIDRVAREIVDAAVEVHRALGPGLLESVYEACLEHELKSRGMAVRRQVQLPVEYKGTQIEAGMRLDLLVGDRVVVELKSVEELAPVHKAQVLTYLKLTGYRLGLLLNFNVVLMRDGIQRSIL